MNEVERQKAHFTAVAGRYIEARRHANHLQLKRLLWAHFFARNRVLTERPLNVLEPMCGYGEGYELLRQYCHPASTYSGMDISEPMVAEAITRHPGVNFRVGDVTKPFGDATYDLVIILGGLHHVFSNINVALGNVARALKPGGYFLNLEPTENNAIATAIRNRIYRTNDLFDSTTERGFKLTELNQLYEESNLTVRDQVYPGLAAYVLYYNPDAFPKLNLGTPGIVRALFAAEKTFYANCIGRKASFATLSLLQRS